MDGRGEFRNFEQSLSGRCRPPHRGQFLYALARADGLQGSKSLRPVAAMVRLQAGSDLHVPLVVPEVSQALREFLRRGLRSPGLCFESRGPLGQAGVAVPAARPF